MTSLTLVAFPGNAALTDKLAAQLDARTTTVSVHVFPDAETAVRLPVPCDGDLAFVCTLDRPNEKFLPLIFAARTAREMGARRIGLVAPYLAYLRQDSRFADGAAVSAKLFAGELSRAFDWIATVDPHLHRIAALSDIVDIACDTVHAAPALATWIAERITAPVLVGPDGESGQWVSEVARLCNAPFATFTKTRLADERVVLSADVPLHASHMPVILDDIISTAHTMAEAVRLIGDSFQARPWCVGIHAVFAPGAHDLLAAARPAGIVTTNTIAHASNEIDISPLLAAAIRRLTAGSA
jgi:ribose-phosphate pyrophosphokinase